MKIRIVSAVLVMLLLTATPSSAATSNQYEDSYAMPMAEIKEVISDWLEQHGFQIYLVSSGPQHIKFTAEQPDADLAVTLVPQSPLATRVTMDAGKAGGSPHMEALRRYLKGYIEFPVDVGKDEAQSVPDVVRGQTRAVVCIYANSRHEDIQVTGFVIDRGGWVVCTAHDLKPGQHVTVVLYNGHEIGGSVAKHDPGRDLSLIRTETALPADVSLRDGRFSLRNGDELFAVTCPNGGDGIQGGFIDGPPRRVSGLALWQARIHIKPGNSGSPVFDGHGRLTAVVKGRYRGTDAIGFLIPFETLLNFLEKY